MSIDDLLRRFPLPPVPARPVRVAVIGCGGHAECVHFPALGFLRERGWPVEVAAVCDVNPERLALAARVFPEARTGADAGALIASELCDAVLLITPPGICADLCRLALEACKPTLVEKPVASDVETLDCLASLAAERRVPVQVAYNRRHQPLLGEFLEQLRLHPPQHVHARFYRVARDEPSFYADTAVHQMDLLLHCFGPLRVLGAWGWPALSGGGLAAGMCIRFLSERGVTIDMDIRPAAGRMLETIEAIAPRHTTYLSYQQRPVPYAPPELAVYDDGRPTTLFRHEPSAATDIPTLFVQGFIQQLCVFLRLAAGDLAASPCPLDDAARTRRLYLEIAGALRDAQA